MLIPPCVLMIVWGILTEQSIGAIFLAGVLPGLLLASIFMALHHRRRASSEPHAVGEATKTSGEPRPPVRCSSADQPL